jgi:hypothetical protein
MNIISLANEYIEEVERIVARTWGSLKVAAHHELFDVRELPCFIAVSDRQELLGYCYYRIHGKECEIMAIESIMPNIGVGSALIGAVTKNAADNSCKRV